MLWLAPPPIQPSSSVSRSMMGVFVLVILTDLDSVDLAETGLMRSIGSFLEANSPGLSSGPVPTDEPAAMKSSRLGEGLTARGLRLASSSQVIHFPVALYVLPLPLSRSTTGHSMRGCLDLEMRAPAECSWTCATSLASSGVCDWSQIWLRRLWRLKIR